MSKKTKTSKTPTRAPVRTATNGRGRSGASTSARFTVKRARKGAGLGLFAEVPFKKDDFIIEYKGKRVPNDVADDLGTKYLFEVGEHWTIDGSSRKNIARYINHSCKPNAEAEEDEDELRIRFYAKKKIQPGDELTIDYGDEYFDQFIRPYGCKCDACVGE